MHGCVKLGKNVAFKYLDNKKPMSSELAFFNTIKSESCNQALNLSRRCKAEVMH